MKAKELLQTLNACSAAINWVENRTIQEAWDECPRGDWMLWFYKKQYPENTKELALAKGHCANTVRHLMMDPRSLSAVDAAIAYGEGKIDLQELKKATTAAYAATTAATYAATAATYAASNAYAAAYAASNAYAAATYAATYAATAAAYAAAAAKTQNQHQTADICRKYLSLSL